MTLHGKRIVVLGGTSGIGLALAEAASAQGAQIVVASSNASRVADTVRALPAGSEGLPLDLLDEAAVRDFFEAIGPYDHLVYTAGEPLRLTPLADLVVTDAKRFFELRYWGAVAAAKWGYQQIRPGGSITFTSGTAGARPGPGWTIASSICSAMEALTRALALELAPLRVNIVSPGVVKSPLWRGMDEAARDALYASEAARLPIGHVIETREVALGYLYLMQQTSVTGQTLQIDGGGLLV
jgi:NAD(P)-dependent dehydrogenase (short-subunit alcohol dehydrogenase family)